MTKSKSKGSVKASPSKKQLDGQSLADGGVAGSMVGGSTQGGPGSPNPQAAVQEMKKSLFWRDTALIRYDESQCYGNQSVVQVVNDTGLMGIFGKRTNDDTWKKLDCIQTSVCS